MDEVFGFVYNSLTVTVPLLCATIIRGLLEKAALLIIYKSFDQ